MGTTHHITMIVTSFDEKKLTRTRNKALKLLKKQNITRIIGEGINGYKSFVIVPNGSQAGWSSYVEHREGILKLKEWIDETMPYEDGSTSVKYVISEFGEYGLQSTNDKGYDLESNEVYPESGAW